MASLPPLADTVDVEDRLGRSLVAGPESRRATALMSDASTVVRNYTRRDFTQATVTSRHRPLGNKVLLPLRPVINVAKVSAVRSFGTTVFTTPLALWSWVGGYEVVIRDQTLVINGPTLDWDDTNVWAEVTYTHGFTTIPDDVRSVVANLVVRNLTVPSGGLIDSETVGPYTAHYSGFTAMGPLGLGEADRQLLNRYRSSASGTVELRG